MQRAKSAATDSAGSGAATTGSPQAQPVVGKPVIAGQPVITGVDGIEGLPPDEKLAALRRVQAQAEQRIRLGMQLFKAAEAHVSGQQHIVEDLRHAQEQLREDLHSDVARSFRSYDEWMGEFGDQIGDRLEKMEGRIEQLQYRWGEIEKRIGMMVKRAEALVEQSRTLLESGVSQIAKRDVAAAKQQCTPAAPAPQVVSTAMTTAMTTAAPPATPTPAAAAPVAPAQSPAPVASAPAAPPSPAASQPGKTRPAAPPAHVDPDPPSEPVFLKVIDKVRQQQTPAAGKSESADAADSKD